MLETLSQNLADALRELLDEGYELTLTRARENCGYLAQLIGPLGSQNIGIGDDLAAAVASVWPLDDLDDLDDDPNTDPYCCTCGAPVGIFHGYGERWYHWRGEATIESSVELYDADHEPEVAWRPAGAR